MPAKAPRPGSRAEAEAARQFIRIRIKDREMDLMPDITLDERFVIRAATGLAWEGFLPPDKSDAAIGEDTLFMLWWIARRQNGEPNLPFKQASSEWRVTLEGVGDQDLDLVLVDLDAEPEDDDSPEGSGPGSETDGLASLTSSASTPGTPDA